MGANERQLTAATWAVVAATVVLVSAGLARLAEFAPEHLVLAVVGTAAYLPLHLWHIHHAARGRRPPAGSVSVAAMAALIALFLPVIGVQWLGASYPLGASLLLALRPAWSVPLFGGLVLAQAPLCVLFGEPGWASNFTFGTVVFGLMLSIPVWLIATLRALYASRGELAEQAVSRERLRVDRQLHDSFGTALDAIVTAGSAASARIGGAPAQAAAELHTVTRDARATLAAARVAISRMQRSSLADELAAGVGLLRTAGIPARLELPTGGVPASVPSSLRERIRAEVAALLLDDSVRSCAFAVRSKRGAVQVELRLDAAGGPREVIVE